MVVLVYTLAGFFVLPPILKSQLEQRLSGELGRPVSVGKVRLNPYAFSVTVEQFAVRERDDAEDWIGWTRLYVNADPMRSLWKAWTLHAVELEGFHAGVTVLPDGALNFADLINKYGATTSNEAPAQPMRPVRLDRLAVSGAQVNFADRSRAQPFATVLGPVTFELKDFQTAGGKDAPYRFDAITEAGEALAWRGTLSAVPLQSTGELRIENIDLPKYAPYYAPLLQADLLAGKLSLQGRYDFKLAGESRVMQLHAGALQLRGLELVERATQAPALTLAALDVTGVEADAVTLRATVDVVDLQGGRVQVRRESDGSINLLKLLPAPAGAATTAAAAETTEPAPTTATPLPEFLIKALALTDFQIAVEDQAGPRPARLALNALQLALQDVTLAEGAVMPLSLAFDWVPQGTVKIDGTVALKPTIETELRTEVTALSIQPLSPYLEQFINARLTQGSVTTSGQVQVALTGDSPDVTFAGGITVEQLGLVDGVLNEDLAGFGALSFIGLSAATAPKLTVTLDEINLAAPYARVLVNDDGALNLAALAVEAETVPESGTEKTAPAADAPAALPRIEIGRVVISDGRFSLTDRSLEPNVRMAMTAFGGTVAGLSSENLARADVDLKAVVDGVGPVAIGGTIDVLGATRHVDLKVDFKNVDLLPLSPYSGKFAGYELARGKLNLDVQAKVDDRRLDASNVITLEQFTFGAPVESPDATKLPVRLAVALLKDVEGRIVIDVPVEGSMDDPSFRVGRVVGRVIVNLLTKAAVSPFALLGSMFGGGGEELAFQEFAPGTAELLPAEMGKLDTMVKALTNRPGLSLSIEGGYDAPADSYALRQQKLAGLVRNSIWAARHAEDPNIPPPDALEITPEAHAAMVKSLYDAQFPPGTEFGAPLAEPPAVVAAPEAPKKGFIRRVIAALTSGGDEETTVATAEAETAVTPAEDAGPGLEEMTGRLVETMEINENDLRALADARAQRVRDYLLNEGGIDAGRLFLASVDTAAKENRGPRVFLSLQ